MQGARTGDAQAHVTCLVAEVALEEDGEERDLQDEEVGGDHQRTDPHKERARPIFDVLVLRIFEKPLGGHEEHPNGRQEQAGQHSIEGQELSFTSLSYQIELEVRELQILVYSNEMRILFRYDNYLGDLGTFFIELIPSIIGIYLFYELQMIKDLLLDRAELFASADSELLAFNDPPLIFSCT